MLSGLLMRQGGVRIGFSLEYSVWMMHIFGTCVSFTVS